MSYSMFMIVATIIGAIVLVFSSYFLLRKQIFHVWLIGSIAFLLAFCSAVVINMALNLREFDAIEPNRLIAKFEFKRMAPQVYRATIEAADGTLSSPIIRGDLWQVELEYLRWSSELVSDGFRLASIRGRYLTLEQEQAATREALPLKRNSPGLDLWSVAYGHSWMPLVEAELEKINFLPLSEGALFALSFDINRELSIRPLNDAAEVVFQKIEGAQQEN